MDPIAVTNLIFTVVTTCCALYLSLMALRHSAKPKVCVVMRTPTKLGCGEEHQFVFEFRNVGQWYGKPTAIDVVVFCNFAPAFSLVELQYGSDQSFTASEYRVGVGRMKYLKARGLKLTYGDEPEEIHVRVITPSMAGRYKIRISAFSTNGVSLKKEYWIDCGLGENVREQWWDHCGRRMNEEMVHFRRRVAARHIGVTGNGNHSGTISVAER